MQPAAFWTRLDNLVRAATIVIDRPAGTPHPRFPEFIYPLDYGYLVGQRAYDGDGVDIWLGHAAEPQTTAIICTVDEVALDVELKILWACTPEEINTIWQTHNRGSQSGLLVKRQPDDPAGGPSEK